jgi:non-ribosomal peptide synthetase component F
MKITPQPQNFPDDQTVVLMNNLPADVNPDNPANPANDVFRIIPAGSAMTPALEEDLLLPVNHKTLLRHDPDLRGHRVYLRLQFDHQAIAPALEAELSDRWASFGVPWTGMTRTNTLTFDVPKNPPAAKPCVDTRIPERFDGHLQTGNNR